jgi:NTP pyrophosphatase (non-canonical NTP hydrolase)
MEDKDVVVTHGVPGGVKLCGNCSNYRDTKCLNYPACGGPLLVDREWPACHLWTQSAISKNIIQDMDALSVKYIDFINDVARTWKQQGGAKLNLAVAALGLVCEAGEVGDIIKKELAQGHPTNLPKIVDELGDTFYYMVKVMELYGISLTDIIAANIEKRQIRYPDGFDPEKSIGRGR